MSDVYRSIDDPSKLHPRERDPRSGRRRSTRDQKQRDQAPSLPTQGGRKVPRRVLVGALLVAAVLIGGAIALVAGDEGGEDTEVETAAKQEGGSSTTRRSTPASTTTTTEAPPPDAPDITGRWQGLNGGNIFEITKEGDQLLFKAVKRNSATCNDVFLTEPRPIFWSDGAWAMTDWRIDRESCEILEEGTTYLRLIGTDELVYEGIVSIGPYERIG